MFLISFNGVTQESAGRIGGFADAAYYLVDSLMLEELSEGDIELLESSLKEYHSAKDDTTKVNILTNICENMNHSYWIKYQFFQYKFIKDLLLTNPSPKAKKNLMVSLSGALNNIGIIYHQQSNGEMALKYYQKSVIIDKKLGEKENLANTLNNMGQIHYKHGNIPEALIIFTESLKISDEVNYKKGIAYSLNLLGDVYLQQKDYVKAEEYFKKSLKIREVLGDKKMISSALNNLGSFFDMQRNFSKAMEYHLLSLKIKEEIGDKRGIANTYNNI